MPVPTLADTWKVIVHYHVGATQCENVFHTTADDASVEQDIADDFGAAWMDSTSLSSIQHSATVGGDIIVQHYDGTSAPVDCVVSGFTGVSMGDSGAPVPAAVSGLITWKTGLAGRSFRGRTYLAGVSNNYVQADGSQWQPSFVPTLQAAAQAFNDLLVGATTVTGLDVYSEKNNTKAPVTAVLFRPYFGTQRRRAEQAE